MRDHPNHGDAILGGMWDADLTRQESRSEWKYTMKLMLNDPQAFTWRWGPDQDQELLAR